MALDTLWTSVWPPSDVPLDRAGRRFLRRRDRAVRAELYYCGHDRRLRPGLAADRSGPVCAIDHIPADCRIKVCGMEQTEKKHKKRARVQPSDEPRNCTPTYF